MACVVGCHHADVEDIGFAQADGGEQTSSWLLEAPPLCAVAFQLGSEAGDGTRLASGEPEEGGTFYATLSRPSPDNPYPHLWWLAPGEPEFGAFRLENLRHAGQFLTRNLQLNPLPPQGDHPEEAEWWVRRLGPVSRTDSTDALRFQLVPLARPDLALTAVAGAAAPELAPTGAASAQRFFLEPIELCGL